MPVPEIVAKISTRGWHFRRWANGDVVIEKLPLAKAQRRFSAAEWRMIFEALEWHEDEGAEHPEDVWPEDDPF